LLVAAGATKALTVRDGDTKNFQVYSLPDLTPGPTANLDELFFGPSSIAMGSNTDGPVLTQDFAGQVALIDIGGVPQVIPGSVEKPGLPVGPVRASADGRLFVASNDGDAGYMTEKNRKWAVTRVGTRPAFPS